MDACLPFNRKKHPFFRAPWNPVRIERIAQRVLRRAVAAWQPGRRGTQGSPRISQRNV